MKKGNKFMQPMKITFGRKPKIKSKVKPNKSGKSK